MDAKEMTHIPNRWVGPDVISPTKVINVLQLDVTVRICI